MGSGWTRIVARTDFGYGRWFPERTFAIFSLYLDPTGGDSELCPTRYFCDGAARIPGAPAVLEWFYSMRRKGLRTPGTTSFQASTGVESTARRRGGVHCLGADDYFFGFRVPLRPGRLLDCQFSPYPHSGEAGRAGIPRLQAWVFALGVVPSVLNYLCPQLFVLNYCPQLFESAGFAMRHQVFAESYDN